MSRDPAALTPKEEAFVAEFLVCLNATKAYLAAGYKEGKNPDADAAKVMARPRVREAIAEGKAERAKRFRATQDRVIEELSAIAFSRMTDVATWSPHHMTLRPSDELHPEAAAAIATLAFGEHGPKLKMHDKVRALQLLMNHLGMRTGDGLPVAPDPGQLASLMGAYAALLEGPSRDAGAPPP